MATDPLRQALIEVKDRLLKLSFDRHTSLVRYIYAELDADALRQVKAKALVAEQPEPSPLEHKKWCSTLAYACDCGAQDRLDEARDAAQGAAEDKP